MRVIILDQGWAIINTQRAICSISHTHTQKKKKRKPQNLFDILNYPIGSSVITLFLMPEKAKEKATQACPA